MDNPGTTPNSSPPSRKQNGTSQPVSLQPATEAMHQGLEDLNRSKRLLTMWPRMQRLCPPRHARLWFIGGQPGNYKTQLMWNLALDMASLHQRVLFISLEQTTGETALQAVARYSRIPIDAMEIAKRNGGLSTEQAEGMAVAARKLTETEMFLRMHGADAHGRSLEDVIRSASRSRFDAIFLDHIGMVGRDSGNELEQLSTAIDRLRGLTRGSLVPGYTPFICATTPLKRDAATGDEEKLPAITDFRGSSRLEYDADLAMILRKRKRKETAGADDHDVPDVVDGFVLKNRKGPCPVVLQFDAQGSICFVNERKQDAAEPPRHYSETGES